MRSGSESVVRSVCDSWFPANTNEVSTPSFSSISPPRPPLEELATQNFGRLLMVGLMVWVTDAHVVTSPKSDVVSRMRMFGEADRLFGETRPLVPAGTALWPPASALSTSTASQETRTGSSTVTVMSREGSMPRT